MSTKLSQVLVWLIPLAFLIAAIALELAGIGGIATTVREWAAGELGRFAPRPDFAAQAELLFVALFGIIVIVFFAQGEALVAGIVAVAGICIALVISWRAEIDAQIFVDPVYPSLVIAIVYVLARVTHALHLSATRKMFGPGSTPRLESARAADAARHSELSEIPGQTRNITYLVCNLHELSAFAQANDLNAAGIAAVSQKIMTWMAQTILDKGGMIDHVTPAKITALFNAPLEDPKHAAHACECALAMVEQLRSVNHSMAKDLLAGGVPNASIKMGIGIETGRCAVGSFGTEDHPEYSTIGPAVEFAEEIESLGAKYGPSIMVGSGTHTEAEQSFALLEVDLLGAGPQGKPVPVFALLGNAGVRGSPKFRALQTFHEHIFRTYRARQWGKARALIEKCRALSGPDPISYSLYLDRISYLERQPPGEDWDGVFRPPQL
jgi:adenylate cyclase